MKSFFLSILISSYFVQSSLAQAVYKNNELVISLLKKNTWIVETNDMTTMYIIEGEERSMLIDTGTKCANLLNIIKQIQ